MNRAIKHAAWRIGRKLYTWARGDLANDPTRNGEYWLLRHYFASRRPGSHAVLFDIGANVGNWTQAALDAAGGAHGDVTAIFAFEPSAATRAMLVSNVEHCNQVHVVPVALSSTAGQATFYGNGVGSGSNSLSDASGPACETVDVTTFDAFMQTQQLAQVDFVKIDTEGFDVKVLEGAHTALASGLIELIQFEYNWRWLANHASLRDVFEQIDGTRYRLGKLERESIATFERWHFELDRYFENNYVLIRDDSPLLRICRPRHFDASNVEIDGLN